MSIPNSTNTAVSDNNLLVDSRSPRGSYYCAAKNIFLHFFVRKSCIP